MTQNTHYLDLINTLAKQHKLKQPDLAGILKVNTRQYRRLVDKGLSFDHVNKLLNHFNVQLYAVNTQKECIMQYPLGQ